jgi:hypothetical protein
MDTNKRIDAARLQPVMIGVAVASAVLAALALLLMGKATREQSQFREHFATLSALSQNIPLQAGAAVRGSAPAFDALAESRRRLEQTLHESGAETGLLGPSDKFGDPAGWTALLEQSQAVLDGREAAIRAQQAAATVRETTPQLLAALTSVVDSVGPAKADNLNRHAERFEVRAQAVEQDMTALADGTAPVEAASRRLADSLEPEPPVERDRGVVVRVHRQHDLLHAAADRPAERLGHQRVDVVEQDDVLLAREVAEERRRGDLRRFRDLLDGRPVVASLLEQAEGVLLDGGLGPRLLTLPQSQHGLSRGPGR